MPDCPHLERCGGCPLMHLAAADQLAHKRALVRDAFAGYVSLAGLDVMVEPADPPLAYRTRVKWMAAGGKLGMYARGGGHEVVDTPECRVASPLLLSVASAVRQRSARLPLAAVDLREALTPDGPRALVTLVTKSAAREAQAIARELLATSGVAGT